MLLSMTGFGRAVGSHKDKTITVEIRSLNSKFTDIRFKLPQSYREKELELKKLVNDKSERGKVDVLVDTKSMQGDEDYALNEVLFTKYYERLSNLAKTNGMPQGDLMQAILKLPNVVATNDSEIEDEEWTALTATVKEALKKFHQFRLDEGKSIEEDLKGRIHEILNSLAALAPFEAERIPKIRQRMMQNLEEFLGKENVDKNRFEQEVLFYIEKIDINEEKVRLEQHCKYFLEQLATPNTLKGRKLSFISQEIGREINTLGSKAYSSDIQRHVVKMKDELEKIKEQVLNAV